MPFEPGQSGNPSGAPKRAKLFRDALLVAIKQADADGVEALQRVANKIVSQAADGDVQAFREIADRIDGKVPQAVVGDDEHDPLRLVHRIERVIVKAANPDGGDIPAAPDAGPI